MLKQKTIASNAIPATPTWIVKMLKYWQYGDNIELDSNLAFYYPIINTTKNIITRVSVFTTANKTVQIPIYKTEGQFGDLYITYTIKTPVNLTEKEKELFSELSKLRSHE